MLSQIMHGPAAMTRPDPIPGGAISVWLYDAGGEMRAYRELGEVLAIVPRDGLPVSLVAVVIPGTGEGCTLIRTEVVQGAGDTWGAVGGGPLEWDMWPVPPAVHMWLASLIAAA